MYSHANGLLPMKAQKIDHVHARKGDTRRVTSSDLASDRSKQSIGPHSREPLGE